MANALMDLKDNEDEIFIISDTEENADVTTQKSTIIPLPMSNKIIDLTIDLTDPKSDKGPKKLNNKYKPCPKSKKKFIYIDDGDEEPINIEPETTLSNTSYLSTTKRKRTPAPKSKTMFVGDVVPSNAENKNC